MEFKIHFFLKLIIFLGLIQINWIDLFDFIWKKRSCAEKIGIT